MSRRAILSQSSRVDVVYEADQALYTYQEERREETSQRLTRPAQGEEKSFAHFYKSIPSPLSCIPSPL